ncbi:hypothetical protein LCGC14_2221090 [marine sediment metagenome]|uniref:Uncharacterized protein n=1 Tax=marine sediment metagenome TaxID=412755 RepID=A0A0F9FNI7_9ZZZZ
MKFNTVDKLMIHHLLPQTESIIIQMLARDINRKTNITQKESKIIKLESTENGITWETKNLKKTECNIDFSEAEIRMLQDRVDSMDKEKKITSTMLDTVLKIKDIKFEGK